MKVGIIGVPQDIGSSKRGVDMGPSAIRVAGLHENLRALGVSVKDYGNIACFDIDQNPGYLHAEERLNFIGPIVDTCYRLKNQVERAIADGCFPLVIGGDHSISIGTLAGMKSLHGGKTGIIWVDAHADFNTPATTPSGNIHGMVLAVHTGRGDPRLTAIGPAPTVREQNTVLIGARDLDSGELELLRDSAVTVFTMRDIVERGMGPVIKDALAIATDGVDHLHVSFDIDSIDPFEAPGTGTQVAGGITFREARYIMELVSECRKLSSLEVVEVNPVLDTFNKTGRVAVELISCALGKRIVR
jgi:arginase